MKQLLLFPDPRPLLEKLGPNFFRQAPQCPGVYLMHDARDAVLYVGKAKNLRHRLASYRVANPDRMPRRHLRLLRTVARIDLQTCADEASALALEADLIRRLKPKFNRAGTWPGPLRFLLWRQRGQHLELALSDQPEEQWEAFGPLGRLALSLRAALARVFWCAVHPGLGAAQMPLGWPHGQFEPITRIQLGAVDDTVPLLQKLFSDRSNPLVEWVSGRLTANMHCFDQTVLTADLELLSNLDRLPVACLAPRAPQGE